MRVTSDTDQPSRRFGFAQYSEHTQPKRRHTDFLGRDAKVERIDFRYGAARGPRRVLLGSLGGVTMRSTLTTFMLGIICPVAASAQGFFDDFSSGGDTSWTRVDLLDAAGLGPTVYDTSSGRYAISSAAELPQL